MPAFAAVNVTGIANLSSGILLTTDAAIGVDRTLSPDRIDPAGVAKWVDRSGGIAIGYPAMTLSVRSPSKTSRLTKVIVKVSIPTLEQTSASTASGIQPQPTKAYDCSFVGEFMLPERSTSAERVLLMSNVLSLFMTTINASDGTPTDASGSPLRAAVIDLESVY